MTPIGHVDVGLCRCQTLRGGSLTVSTSARCQSGPLSTPGDDVGDVEDAGDEEDFFDALVVALDDEQPRR